MTEQVPVAEAQSEEINAKTTKKPKGPVLWPLYFLIFLMAIGIGVAGSGLWYQHKTDIAALQKKISEQPKPVVSDAQEGVADVDLAVVEADIKALREALALSQEADTELKTEAAVKALGIQMASIKSQLQAQTDTNRDDWKLAEAEFLLHLASQRALLAHNSHEALQLTQSVDDILRDRSDPQLFAVRQVLADEISALKNIKPIDTEGVYLRLQALKNAVVKLKLVKPFERSVVREAKAENTASAIDTTTVWGKVQSSVKQALVALGTYVRVREHEAVVEPLLAPDYTYYLQQNLMLMLEQAQAALLREENKIYQTSLTKAEAWINQYFTSNAEADHVRQEINALKTLELNVNLPDISKALRLLKVYIHDVHNVETKTSNAVATDVTGDAP